MFLILIGFYAVEHARLRKIRGRIPLRICVTGTRGKSSVVRMLAAVMRESGRTVLAKTTGSRPMLILPSGEDVELFRAGRPSVLEQIRVLRRAAELKADAVVIEMMSIRPEILSIESRRIVQPGVLLITNARSDHWQHWGSSRETAVRSLAAAVCAGADVYVPAEENTAEWQAAADRAGARLHAVTAGPPGGVFDEADRENVNSDPNQGLRFDADLRLVLAAADHLGIGPGAAREGVKQAQPDLGELKIWRFRMGPEAPELDCVNAFAANDPESTRRVLRRLGKREGLGGKPVCGLLALRRDRADRTQQWLEAFRSGDFADLSCLFVIGDRNRAFERGMASLSASFEIQVLAGRAAEAVMASLSRRLSGPAVLVLGMGNMVGAGREIVEFWEREGEDIGV